MQLETIGWAKVGQYFILNTSNPTLEGKILAFSQRIINDCINDTNKLKFTSHGNRIWKNQIFSVLYYQIISK